MIVFIVRSSDDLLMSRIKSTIENVHRIVHGLSGDKQHENFMRLRYIIALVVCFIFVIKFPLGHLVGVQYSNLDFVDNADVDFTALRRHIPRSAPAHSQPQF